MLSKLYDRAIAGMNKYYTLATLLGFLLVWGDMKLSGQFGATISENMEVIAMGISLASGILLVIAAYHYFKGVKWIGQGLAAIWVIAFGFNVYSNMGVATSDRQQNIVNADFKSDTRADMVNTRKDLEAKLKLFDERRAKLEAQMATLSEKKINGGWTVSIAPGQSPESFDGMITAKTLERDNESKRGGCGPKCEARTNELAHLQALRALAVSFVQNRDQHAATLEILDKTRKDLADTPPGHSTVKAQSSLHALLIERRLSGDVNKLGVQAANNFTGVFVAFVLAIVAAGVTLASAWPVIMSAPAISLAAPAPSPMPRTKRPTASDIAQRFAHKTVDPPAMRAPTPSPTVITRERPGFDVRALIDRMQAVGA